MNRNTQNGRAAIWQTFTEAMRPNIDLTDPRNQASIAAVNAMIEAGVRLGYPHPDWIGKRMEWYFANPDPKGYETEARAIVNDLIAFVGAMTLMDLADSIKSTFQERIPKIEAPEIS
jgi:hypothetical protein